jgi:hypothetical protein
VTRALISIRIWIRSALEATQALPTKREPYPLHRRESATPRSRAVESVLKGEEEAMHAMIVKQAIARVLGAEA